MPFSRMCCFSISSVLGLSLRVLPIVYFAPVRLVTPVFRSISFGFNHVTSIGRVPKSLDIDRNSAMRVVACAISLLSCSVVGIFGSLS